jgi:glutaredoxin
MKFSKSILINQEDKMDKIQVEGNNKGDIQLYTLSTCIWCKKTKQLLNSMNIRYQYIDIDLLEGENREKALKELDAYNPKRSFPTLVINGMSIKGFMEDEIKELLQ